MKQVPGLNGLFPETLAEAEALGPQGRLDVALQIIPSIFIQAESVAKVPEEVREALFDGIWSGYGDLGLLAMEGKAKNMQAIQALVCFGMITMSYCGYLEQRIAALEEGTTLELRKAADEALMRQRLREAINRLAAEEDSIQIASDEEREINRRMSGDKPGATLDDRKIDKGGDL